MLPLFILIGVLRRIVLTLINNIMRNKRLQLDLDKLLSYDSYCYTDITTDYDVYLGYILDVKDSSYFYISEVDRDYDDSLIMQLLKDKFYM